MKTAKITVFQLFDTQIRYLVPIFQRGYVWTRAGQWEPLWEDIIEQTATVNLHIKNPKSGLRKHFLGAVVLSQVPTSVRQVAAYEIIDGQQRLLTLQVFMAAFRDAIANLNERFLSMQLARLTANPQPTHYDNEQYKVWPTGAYQDDIRNVMGAGSPEPLALKYPQRRRYGKLVPPRPGLVDAYFLFHQKISEYLSAVEDGEDGETSHPPTEEEIKQRANALFQAALRSIQIVEIQLESEDDPQVIFETLNYQGVPLEPSDLIRNFIFLLATRQEKDVSALYSQYWKDYDETDSASIRFWKEKERQGRFFRSRLDLFFFHYLTYRSGHEVKMGPLYQEFKNWWETDDKREIERELDSAKRSSKVFHSLLAVDDNTRFGALVQRLRILDTTTVYPFLLWLCEHRETVAQNEFDGILSDIESYVVRRAVCRLTPKNYNRTFLMLLSKLQAEGLPNRSSLQRELLALSGDSVVWPEDDKFGNSLIWDPLYDLIGPRRTRLVLTALEHASRTPKQESPLAVVPINNNLTVEHVLPQAFHIEDYPYPSSTESDEATLLNHRRVLIHSLGNLTLLTQPLNSDVSNGPFSVKRREICSQSLLVLNSYFQQFSEGEIWDEGKIVDRGQSLAEVAMKVWPRPSTAEQVSVCRFR